MNKRTKLLLGIVGVCAAALAWTFIGGVVVEKIGRDKYQGKKYPGLGDYRDACAAASGRTSESLGGWGQLNVDCFSDEATTDAGKSCYDNADCQGRCEGGPIGDMLDSEGTCSASNKKAMPWKQF